MSTSPQFRPGPQHLFWLSFYSFQGGEHPKLHDGAHRPPAGIAGNGGQKVGGMLAPDHVLCVYQVPTLRCLISPLAVIGGASVVIFDAGAADLTPKPLCVLIIVDCLWALCCFPPLVEFLWVASAWVVLW